MMFRFVMKTGVFLAELKKVDRLKRFPTESLKKNHEISPFTGQIQS